MHHLNLDPLNIMYQYTIYPIDQILIFALLIHSLTFMSNDSIKILTIKFPPHFYASTLIIHSHAFLNHLSPDSYHSAIMIYSTSHYDIIYRLSPIYLSTNPYPIIVYLPHSILYLYLYIYTITFISKFYSPNRLKSFYISIVYAFIISNYFYYSQY